MKYSLHRMVLVFIGFIALAGCGGGKNDPSQQKAPPPVAVNIYTVEEGSGRYFDSYPATITALNQVDVRPQVAGYITGIFFKEGSHVNKGEKLYSIDAQQYLGAYEQAVANLNVAKANLAKAQQDADRYEELAKQDAIARQTLDHAQADLESSKRQVDAAKANVSAVETNVKYSSIYAPFSGTIGISQVKLGASVAPGQTVLNTISTDDPVTVDFAVDQKLIPGFVALQQEPKLNAKDSTFRLSLPDGSTYPYPGHIFFIDRAVDPQTGTIITRLEFPNPKKVLRIGMTCNVKISNATGLNSILIPYKSIVEQMGEFFVYVVNDSSKVSAHKIQLGQRIQDKVVVKEGLNVGQRIVTDGVQKLKEGSTVQLAPAQQPGSGRNDSTKGK